MGEKQESEYNNLPIHNKGKHAYLYLIICVLNTKTGRCQRLMKIDAHGKVKLLTGATVGEGNCSLNVFLFSSTFNLVECISIELNSANFHNNNFIIPITLKLRAIVLILFLPLADQWVD